MTEQAFEAMVRQYEKLVYTVCCQLVHDHQLAEDLSQETFVSAYLWKAVRRARKSPGCAALR